MQLSWLVNILGGRDKIMREIMPALLHNLDPAEIERELPAWLRPQHLDERQFMALAGAVHDEEARRKLVLRTKAEERAREILAAGLNGKG